MHLKRLIVAAILLPVFYLSIMHLPPQFFLVLLLCVSSIALTEFYSMYRVKGILKYTCFLLGIIILSFSYFSRGLLFPMTILPGTLHLSDQLG